MRKIHKAVLLNETIKYLNIKPDSFYIDCTLGDGGHSFEIYQQLSKRGLLLSLDQDKYAIDFVNSYYKDEIGKNWHIKKANFSSLDVVLEKYDRKPNGIVMDLGLSSRQIEQSHQRGFSYREEEEPLDMRMDSELQVTAKDLLAGLTERELVYLFTIYGEERYSKRIASEIKENITDINTVGDLTRLVYRVVPAAHQSSKNPSRRVFQALRIAVNDEINALKIGLDKAFKLLQPRGRMCVISFHSLEDRVVKEFFNKLVSGKKGLLLSKDIIAPTEKEMKSNPRATWAKLRVIEKDNRLPNEK